jgi:TRAP transporter 4TM/12TM fusion protein
MAGPIYTVVCILIGLYPVFAGHMPSIFFGNSFSLLETVGFNVFGSEGIIGMPTKVLGELLIGFLLFAAVLITSGAGQFFINFALATCGRFRGGPAKVSVLSSSFFGTVSGSAVANVVADGPVTIPTMIGVGFPPHHAAAIEAVTSTGGILMPPVMGAVAFVMAAFLGIEYRQVCIAAAIPAFLYYFSLLMQIDAYSAKTGLKGLSREQLPSLKRTMKTGWPFLAVILFLLWGLLYMGWEMYTPYYASLLMLLLSFWSKETRMTPKKLISSLITGGSIITQTVAVMVPIGFIISGLTVPGTSASFTSGIVHLSGGNVLLMLILGVVACYILGMAGMLVSAYIFLAVTLAPAAIQLGHFSPIAVHLFIIYYCMISVITPPVAVAAFVAAAIGGADPMKTGFKAMRLGVAIYFLPFFFLYNPSLIFQGSIPETLFRLLMCMLGLTLIGAANEGYFWLIGNIGLVERVLIFICGLLFAFPETTTDIIGFFGVIAVLIEIWLRKRIVSRKEIAVSGIK